MPWNLLLFPLLAGFQFIHICHLYRYRSKRFESERLLLESASWGVVFLVFARLITYGAYFFEPGKLISSLLNNLVPPHDEPYLGTALASLTCGYIFAHLVNTSFRVAERCSDRVKPLKLRIVERYDNGLLKLFHEAMYMDQPVSITLSSRKVYVGYIQETPTDSPHDFYFTLVLLLSGYRDDETMAMKEDINYADISDPEDGNVFFITLSMNDVVSANFFDLDTYKEHFAPHQMLLAPRD